MTYQIAYGRDTESLEDPGQLVLLDLPEVCSDMDSDELTEWINENWDDPGVRSQEIVGITDVMESLSLILDAETNAATAKRILDSLSDALTNNL